MIYNLTYNNKRANTAINELVGKPFGFRERWKMGRVGSRKMLLTAHSHAFEDLINPDHYSTFASIELRRDGIIVHFQQGYRNFAWPIPFYKLVIYQSRGISIHAEGHYLKFEKAKTDHLRFVKTIIDKKAKWQGSLGHLSF